MKIKIIDLLNKIANGEKSINVETKYDSNVWEKDDFLFSFYKEFERRNNYEVVKFLNDKVEIIGEPKKIEKIEKPTKDEYLYSNGKELYENDMKVYDKINELIDEINNLKEND